MPDVLKYSVIDELELAFANGDRDLPSDGYRATSLGPVIQLSRSPAQTEIRNAVVVEFGDLEEALPFINCPKGLCLARSRSFGLAATCEDGSLAFELMQHALVAINRSDFSRAAAAQAVSALGELDSNIWEHSLNSEGGFVAFEVNRNFVGIYASDSGQGALRSLAANPRYANLDDEAEALTMVLQEGVSSSAEEGRGMGFRPIFVGLASHSGLLRFRSGDALLEIDGFGRDVPRQTMKERSELAGFHVFVHCTFQ